MKNLKVLQFETDLASQIVVLLKDRGIQEGYLLDMRSMIRDLNFACFVFFIDFAINLLDQKKQAYVNLSTYATPSVVRICDAQDAPHYSREYSIYDALEKHLILLRALYIKDGSAIDNGVLVAYDNIRFLVIGESSLSFPSSESFKSLVRDASACASLIQRLANVVYLFKVNPLPDSYGRFIASLEKLFRMMRDIELDRVNNKHYCSGECGAVRIMSDCLDAIYSVRNSVSSCDGNPINDVDAVTEKLKTLCEEGHALVYARSSALFAGVGNGNKDYDMLNALSNAISMPDMSVDVFSWVGLVITTRVLRNIVKSTDLSECAVGYNNGDLRFFYNTVREVSNDLSLEILDQCFDVLGCASAFMQVAAHLKHPTSVLDDADIEAIASMSEAESPHRC